jgi:hypothetical protein
MQGHYFEDNKFQTPSAPPIAGDEEEVMFDAVGEKSIPLYNRNIVQFCASTFMLAFDLKTFMLQTETAETTAGLERNGLSSVADILAHDVHELPTR